MTKNRSLVLGLAMLALALTPVLTDAASDTKTLTINAIVSARAKLTISPTTINFPDADPDVVDPIPATENSVSVEAKIRTTGAGVATLTCLANGDLVSGTDLIDISNVTWTASGGGYGAGTMNAAVAQSAGSWAGSGSRSGTFDFFLANSWAYAVGNYTQDVVYTLTAP